MIAISFTVVNPNQSGVAEDNLFDVFALINAEKISEILAGANMDKPIAS